MFLSNDYVCRRIILATFLAAAPVAAAALDCRPETACTSDGTCESTLFEEPFRLGFEEEGLALRSLRKDGTVRKRGKPEMLFTEVGSTDEGLRVFFSGDPETGDAALLTLTGRTGFHLSMHGTVFGGPFGLLSSGSCEGTLQ